jgi:hypothetical protein
MQIKQLIIINYKLLINWKHREFYKFIIMEITLLTKYGKMNTKIQIKIF